jgi:hypothetical protein
LLGSWRSQNFDDKKVDGFTWTTNKTRLIGSAEIVTSSGKDHLIEQNKLKAECFFGWNAQFLIS